MMMVMMMMEMMVMMMMREEEGDRVDEMRVGTGQRDEPVKRDRTCG